MDILKYQILMNLGFQKQGKDFFHKEAEIAIEIPSNSLEGDYERVFKVDLQDGKFIYLIGREDIIMDRLRAAVHWKSEEDSKWGFQLLARNLAQVDKDYLYDRIETMEEETLLTEWFNRLKR
ncbi:hypothetical protein [Shouchella shacheensis]|uniref:hypothetical protein n=1 Tax=Shouchella shacheensis TaxID=1649580 RepID=UPI00073FFD71|nr:hypothetical protein [Shouchella shacheensis]